MVGNGLHLRSGWRALIVFDREPIAKWVSERIPGPGTWGEWYQAIGQFKDGKIISGAVYTDKTECGITIHLAGENGWMTKEFVGAIFLYPFKQLKLRRMTALVPAGREDLVRFYSLFGFREEGRLREALPDDDIVLMGLLARDHGQEARSTASAGPEPGRSGANRTEPADSRL